MVVEELAMVDINLGVINNIGMILQEQEAEAGHMSVGDCLTKLGEGLLHLGDEGLIQIDRAEVGVIVGV